ncbi:hypothetical protein H4219_004537 [Mycoemilia scoparia]|uniref:WD40 repeat-like protein n=1 Tax=Mycoemilia scoparia TaxID=417184 RepID=A0A9W8DLC0_9FUNG|nr:hypothetical protein H4219_004537 [Mycoemilia scoparia]
MGSLVEGQTNKLTIAQLSPHHTSEAKTYKPDFETMAEADIDFPMSKVMWQRYKIGISDPNLLATSTNCIRLWRYDNNPNTSGNTPGQLQQVAELRGKDEYGPPLTSFDWNDVDPRILITSSIDTTCTVWDITTQKLKAQLIAHDREVFDVGFFTGSLDCFASVGGDGSVRSFDMRSLEHCSILYEVRAAVAPPPPMSGSGSNASSSAISMSNNNTPPLHQQQYLGGGKKMPKVTSFTPPLMRIACHPTDPNYIATFALDAGVASILDVRVPGIPVLQLIGHKAPIQGITWSPNHRYRICTVGADNNVFVWDIQKSLIIRDQQQRQEAHDAMNQLKTSGGVYPNDVAGGAGAQPTISLKQRSVAVDPSLTYGARMPVSSVSWSTIATEWIGITFGRTFQALQL